MPRPKSIAWIDSDLVQTPSLDDLLTIRPSGLEEAETWAILCQSVQALQDLFLSDGASGKHSLPLITPASLQLSSKGRVNLTFKESFPGCKPPTHLVNYLAPEYKATRRYSDTEYEKMWIFSLGETLKRAVVTRSSSDLWQVLSDMTNPQETLRASLMNLLDVMSQHCKNLHQSRPFSHIIMDLQQETLAGMEASTDLLWGPPAMPEIVPRLQFLKAHRYTRDVSNSMEDLSLPRLDNTPGKVSRPKSMCMPVFEQLEDLPKCHPKRRRLKVRGNPLQRVASRLYSVECKVNACVGPEFVIRAGLPAKRLVLASSKHHVTVILLDGQRLEVTCNPSSTASDQLLQLIIHEEKIVENFLLGLSALIAGDFVFIPSETRISKVLPPGGNWTLYLRVRFFLPSLRGIRSSQTRHLLYLQLRRSVLEHQLPSSFSQIIELNGLALQAEFGDCDPHRGRDYFLLEHYVPETMICLIDDEQRLKQELVRTHLSKKGLDRETAEDQFISFAQTLPHYGGHFYTAVWTLKDESRRDVWLYINAQGINIYQRGKTASHFGPQLYESFDWRNIQTLCYSKHYLTIVPRGAAKLKKYKVKMDSKKSYFAFRLASLHHQFFLKLRSEYMSLQSLSQHFGVALKDVKNATNSLCRRDQKNGRSKSLQDISRSICEELQNKENERPEPRRGVKMGTKAYGRTAPRALVDLDQISLSSVSFHCSSTSLSRGSEGDAFVLDSTLKSVSQQNMLPNFQETISPTFLERLENMSFAEERLLSTVSIHKDSGGSLGLQVTEGSDGNVYIQSVIPGGPASHTKSIVMGDQVVAVNGLSLLGRKYTDSLEIMKNTRSKVEFVLSRVVSRRSPSVHSQVEKHTIESCFDLKSPKYASQKTGCSKDKDKAVIVEMIPKKGLHSGAFPFATSHWSYVKKKQPVALPRSLGLGRRWNGPVRYPVTPVKKTDVTEEETSEEEQVFI